MSSPITAGYALFIAISLLVVEELLMADMLVASGIGTF
ncbi:hypothetical protein BJ956_002642 [Arthrobacter psychrochitiniphilus]|nr:hypothetical protein [Arthrobacter psychrochitiniphilus]